MKNNAVIAGTSRVALRNWVFIGTACLSRGTLAQEINWALPVSANWYTESAWSPSRVPNTVADTAVLGFDAPYTVQLNVGVRIAALRMPNSNARLQVVPGRTLQLTESSVLNGRIDVHDNNSGNAGTALFFSPDSPRPITLSGSGLISLNSRWDSITTWYATLSAGNAAPLEIGPDVKIQGTGTIRGPILLRGTIRTGAPGGGAMDLGGDFSSPPGEGRIIADKGVLTIYDGRHTNTTFEVINPGALRIYRSQYQNPSVFNGIHVVGDVVSFNGNNFSGYVAPIFETAQIDGNFFLESNTGAQLRGPTFTVNGNIRADKYSTLSVLKSTEILGTGTLDLISPFSEPDAAKVTVYDPAILTLPAGRTLRGSGVVSGAISVAGSIVVDEAGGRMRFLTAKLKGLPGARFLIDSGFVILHASSMDGFDISLINGGRFEVWTPNLGGGADPTSTLRNSNLSGPLVCYSKLVLDNATIDGPVLLGPSGSARMEIEGGGARIFGDILLQSDQSAALKFTAPVALGGGGTIRMKAKPGESTSAALTGPSVSPATLGAGWSVEGAGQIAGQFQIGGIVRANLPASGPMRFVDAALTNGGAGAIIVEDADLFVTDSLVSSLPITTSGNARVYLVGNKASPAPAAPATLKSLTLEGPLITTGANAVLENVTIHGSASVESGSSLHLRGNTNSIAGDITLNPTASAQARLLFEQSQSLGGSGSVDLRTPLGALISRAEIGAVAGTQCRLPATRSLIGTGTVSGEWTVEGLISPGTLPSSPIGQMQVVLAPSALGMARRAALAFGPATTLAVDIASVSSFDKIVGVGTKALDGSLVVTLVSGFVPAPSLAFRIVEGTGAVSGIFSSIIPPPDFVAKATYGPTFVDVRLQRVCSADFNRDNIVDVSDFCDFVEAYNIMDCAAAEIPLACQADLNADGVVDDADFQLFVPAYNELLCP